MDTTGTKVEEDIPEIKRKQIIDAWGELKPLRQIADETELAIEVVNRTLKKLLKQAVESE
ncbi:MAG: hypothetical protein M3379_10735 [Acidobacteriota bacterium]|nr:hypothetical protein [Acidobacteriota bacterium]